MRKLILNIALIAAFLTAYVSVSHDAYATVTTATNTITYTGDNSTVAFSFPNLFFDEDHLVVTVDGTTQTITTDYTVTGEGVAAGGTVTFVTAPALDEAIVIQRVVPYVQNTDFSNFDGNPADVTEKQFDLGVMMASQVGESSDRNITVPVGTTLTSNDISGTIDTTTRVLTITTTGPATALVGSLADNLTVALAGQAAGDLLTASDGTTWSNVTQASLGFLTNVISDLTPQAGGDFDMLASQMQWVKGADVASATALPVLTDGNYFDVTGTTAITSINATGGAGTVIKLHFDGILTFTHDATDLILPTGANITTAAGDEVELIEYQAGDYRVTNYMKASGASIAAATGAWTKLVTVSASNSASVNFTTNIDSTYEYYVLTINDLIPATDTANVYIRTDSDGGASFDAGASDYSWHNQRYVDSSGGLSGTNDAADSEIQIVGSAGTTAGETVNATVTIYNPAGTNFTVLGWDARSVISSGEAATDSGVGQRKSAADVDAFQIIMSAGNITSGEFRLYGVEK